MTPNQDRAVQAFDGYVPAAELAAAKADNEHLSALWIAETRENERMLAALKFAKGEFQCLRHWLDRAEASDYKYRDDPALSGHRLACIDAATVMDRALEQDASPK